MFLQAKEGFFNADGSVGEQSRAFLQKFVELFAGWVAQHKR